VRERQVALRESAPIIPAYTILGIAFGVMMQAAGYHMLWSVLAAVFIYAGSMQIVMVSLLVAGLPPYALAVMTFFINARHMFYGVAFVERFRRMGKKYPYMVLSLTDEVYSVLCSIRYPAGLDEQRIDFLISLTCHVTWIAGCTIGAIGGRLIPFDMHGIEFSATAFFVVVVVNQWSQFKSKIPVLAGFASGIFFRLVLGADNFILPALSVSLIVLAVLRSRVERQQQEVDA
jgi:Predicted branched-chain amino acid permease (azaleucine resistance)